MITKKTSTKKSSKKTGKGLSMAERIMSASDNINKTIPKNF